MRDFRKKQLKFGVIAILAVAAIASANLWKRGLGVKTVVVVGNRIVQTNEVVQLAQIQPGTMLYDVDLTAVRRNVESHHYVKSAVVERDLPSAIRITVNERKPVALVNRPDFVYLDEDGVILPRSISKALFDLPVISGISDNVPLKLGTTVGQDDVREALTILRMLKLVNLDLSHQISEVQVRNGGDIVLVTAEGAVPVIFGRGEITDKLLRLEAFWNQVVRVRGTEDLRYIDLRFADQVVVRWNQRRAS
ncbi:MAG TPA: FtsQ-type POTRA domain-containing protein [Bacteroidota bacterium]|nr:FtsQ-type POTRA domain-containing protein [Bacteroidota bacterium]